MSKKIFLYCALWAIVFLSPQRGVAGRRETPAFISPFQDGEQVSQSDPDLEICVSRMNGNIDIDGKLNDAGWEAAVTIRDFFETDPGDNVKPSVETEVRLTYDDRALYVAFHCYDDPATIRATLADRDQFRADDIIFIILDTFHNHQTAYQLGVNPFGLQVDIFRNIDEQDGTFDIVWHSAGRIVDDGWVAEMAVPFKSLRFPNDEEQTWGIHFIRLRPRESYEEISWPSRDRDNPCFLCQAGVLRGIRSVGVARNLEILPYAISFQAGGLSDPGNPTSPFENEDIDADAGFNVKYGLTSDLTLDVAYDPDFSQVESDVAQININTTFALFYPEKRPFFLEGSDIFRSQIHAISTRTINDPLLAAKLTGRIGRTSLGYVLARDDKTPFIVPFEEQSAFVSSSTKSVTNILRCKQDVWEDSFVGLLVTNREVDTGYNRVAGVDASIRFLSEYRLSVQALQSWTKEPRDTTLYEGEGDLTFDEGRYSAAFDGERFDGLGLYATLSRSARHWNFEAFYRDLAPTFRVDNGFVEMNDFRNVGLWSGLLFRPDSRLFDEIYPRATFSWRYNHDGTFRERWIGPELELLFKTQTSVEIGGLVVNDENFRGEWLRGVHRGWLRISTNFSEFVAGGIDFTLGEFINRSDDPSVGVGYGHILSLESTLKLSSQFSIETSYERNLLSEHRGGPEIFDCYVLRNKAVYQFTRRLFLRLVSQYDSLYRKLEIDPLVSYKINPFTVFYTGSTHDIVDFGEPHNWTKTDRQYFIKFQYLWRM